MIHKISLWIRKYLNDQLDLREQIFHQLLLIGMALGVVIGIFSIITHADVIGVIVNFALSVGAFAMLEFSRRTGQNKLLYLISVIVVFLIAFPVLFFTSGGYYSGTPSFFVFAVVFTVFMLEGMTRNIVAALEIVLYLGICLYAYHYPETVFFFETERDMVADIMIGFTISSAALGITVFRYTRIYDRKQKQLAEANAALDRANKLKAELFANVSHEMKTPLTVISVHIQRAEKLFEMARDGDEVKIQESFALAQDEIMRMSRLVNGTLKLASIQEAGGEKSWLDLNSILWTTTEAYRTLLEKHGNTLEVNIPNTLPSIYGSADAMVQIISNLLSNANTHTQNDLVRVNAVADAERLTITVEDNGEGIPPEMLSQIFTRGVSGSGGNGLGLFICRELVQDHGGSLTVESEAGHGAKATIFLPVIRKGVQDGEGFHPFGRGQ